MARGGSREGSVSKVLRSVGSAMSSSLEVSRRDLREREVEESGPWALRLGMEKAESSLASNAVELGV